MTSITTRINFKLQRMKVTQRAKFLTNACWESDDGSDMAHSTKSPNCCSDFFFANELRATRVN